MGARGYNAGGFAYMEWVTCPRCGAKRPLGVDARRKGQTECNNRKACDARREKGHLLHRVSA